MPNFLLIGRFIVLLGFIGLGCYYLFIGIKAFRMESKEFEPTLYTGSSKAHSTLINMLEVTTQVEWDLPGSGRQVAYYRPPEHGPVVILLHGTPGNGVGFRETVIALARFGIGSLAIDLPGYGASAGERSWRAHYEKSVTMGVDWLMRRPEVDGSRISILGYSQGGAVASRSAAREERIGRVILVACYTNLYDQLNHQFRRRLPGIGLFAVAAARFAGVDFELMDNLRALSHLGHKPVLVISGDNDHAIPVAMAHTLAAAVPRGDLWVIRGGNHINLPDTAGPAYYERIAGFSEEGNTTGDS